MRSGQLQYDSNIYIYIYIVESFSNSLLSRAVVDQEMFFKLIQEVSN